jgi:signal transduction histidine kinase/CheY-like chemotaxis protein
VASFLVVDDHRGFLALTGALISRTYPGARVGFASTGQEALERLSAEAWDVTLLDYRLPDVDGLEVLAEIRKRGLATAVIMVTGEGGEELAADLFRMGAYDYLTKGSLDGVALRRSLDHVLTRLDLEAQVRGQTDALVATTRSLVEKNRALDIAYDNIREKREELRTLNDSLEVTVQRRTAELRTATAFLNGVLDATTDHFIIATGPDGTVLVWNRGAEAAFGLHGPDVVGRLHFRELFVELLTDDAAVERLVEGCRESGAIYCTLTGLGPQARRFAAKVSLGRIAAEHEGTDAAAAPTSGGMVILGTDVTHEHELERQNKEWILKLREANARLRRQNQEVLEATRLKSQFLANVSHELRTPLNAVIGYSDLLTGGVYGDLLARQQSAVDGISARARDLLALINDILDLAKIESGRPDLRVESVDLPGIVGTVVETGQLLASHKRLTVSWVDEGALGLPLVTDPHRLRQILLNLVNNGVKFTHEGHVRVKTRPRDLGIEIAVVDTGIGIAAAHRETIFDEFRQVDGTATRQYGGSGLGLAICRKLTAAMAGRLTVESTLGEGSCFTLWLPLDPPAGLRRHDHDDQGPVAELRREIVDTLEIVVPPEPE